MQTPFFVGFSKTQNSNQLNKTQQHSSRSTFSSILTMSINTKLLEEELLEFCGSDSLSLDGLRGIFERHGIATNNNDITTYKFFHRACRNEGVTEGILRLLLEYFPNAARYTDEDYEGCLPLHLILGLNKNVTLGMVQLLIDAFPDSLRHKNKDGTNALHALCVNYNMDDELGLEILKLFLERYHIQNRSVIPLEMTYFQFTLPH